MHAIEIFPQVDMKIDVILKRRKLLGVVIWCLSGKATRNHPCKQFPLANYYTKDSNGQNSNIGIKRDEGGICI